MSTFDGEINTKKYFLEECNRFHEQCGLRGFTLEQRERAFKAITHQWLCLSGLSGQDAEDCDLRYRAETDNFERRWRYFYLEDKRSAREKLDAVEEAGK